MNAMWRAIFRSKGVRGSGATFESICIICLHTVGVGSPEEELVAGETNHICKGRAEQIDLPLRRHTKALSALAMRVLPAVSARVAATRR